MNLHTLLTSLLLTTLSAVPGLGHAEDTATTAPPQLRKLRDVILYNDPHFHSAFPSITALPDGDLLCAFRRAPSRGVLYGAPGSPHTDANSYLVSLRSSDAGETWTSTPELLYAHPFGGSQDPCLLSLSNGTILCTSYGWAPLSDAERAARPNTLNERGFGFLGGYILSSSNGGRQWHGPIYPPALPGNKSVNLQGAPLPAYNRGALHQAADGTVLWAVANHDSMSPLKSSVHLLRSTDGGTSWTYGAPIAVDPGLSFNETSLIETSDGQLVAFLRTTAKDKTAAIARSRDGGKTFQPWEGLDWSGLPLQAIRLRQGGILLVYGYRAKPYGIRARLVADDLSDVKTAPELILRDDGGNPDLGYPWAVETETGKILVVYYINKSNGPRHIAATWLQTQ